MVWPPKPQPGDLLWDLNPNLEAIEDAVDALEEAIENLDPIVTGLVDDPDSGTRASLDDLYTGVVGVDSALYLDPEATGDQSVELGDALVSASTHPAKTLTLRPGTYVIDSTVTVPEGVTVRGLSGATLSTDGDDTILDLSSGVTLDSIRFAGSNSVGGVATKSGQTAVSCVGTGVDRLSDVTIRGCRFEGFEGYGVVFRYTERFTVQGNFFSDWGMSAVGCLCVTDGLIDGNIFRGTGVLPSYSVNSYAVSLSLLSGTIDPVTNYPPARINVTNNLVTNQAWEAIDTHGGDDMVFAGNNIYGCEMGIAVTQKEGLVDGGPAQVTVANNVINRGSYPQLAVRAGISVNGATASGSTKLTGVSVTGNVVKGHGVSKDHPAQASARGGAITMNAVTSAVVAGNLIIDALGSGVSFRNTDTVTVTGNQFQTVWRENGDTRTSTLVYLDGVTTATIVGNSRAVVSTSLPNANEATVRVISGTPRIRQSTNSWDDEWEAVSFSNGWTAGPVNVGVRLDGSQAQINTSFTPPGDSNASGTIIGTVPIAPSVTTRLTASNNEGFAVLLDVNSSGNVVLRSTYNSSAVITLCSAYHL